MNIRADGAQGSGGVIKLDKEPRILSSSVIQLKVASPKKYNSVLRSQEKANLDVVESTIIIYTSSFFHVNSRQILFVI